MNFIVQSSALLKHLQHISGVLNSSNTLPILDNFLFDINDGILTVSASDLETTMKTSLTIQAEESGKVAIPAKFLLDILKTFADQPITFKVDMENFGIEMASENGKYKLVGQNGDDFPKTLSLENSNSIKLAGEVLSEAINKTLFATGNDELRPVMNGVFCQFSSDELIFVATDAHKLVRYTRTDSTASGSSSFILPKKPLNLLKANIKGDEEVSVEYNESNAVFKMNDLVLTCRLIDGKYPNYEAVIPSENPNVLTINRNEMLNSIKRVAIFANKTTHQVRLKLTGSELTISAEDLDFSNEANERLTCHYSGDDMEIGFNSRFLMEMLNNIDGDEVLFQMSEPSRAGLIIPAAKRLEEEDILMLVMPVMLNN